MDKNKGKPKGDAGEQGIERPVIQILEQSKELKEASSPLYRIPVFLSNQGYYNLDEFRQGFLVRVFREIKRELFFPRTLPTTIQKPDPTFESIRRMILSSYGMAAVLLQQAAGESSPYLQIEPAMGFQHGLPLLLVKEAGVEGDGIWTDAPVYMIEWYSQYTTIDEFFGSVEWRELMQNWGTEVRSGYNKQMQPKFTNNGL